MKTKKLLLKKQTIVQLTKNEQTSIVGGTGIVSETCVVDNMPGIQPPPDPEPLLER